MRKAHNMYAISKKPKYPFYRFVLRATYRYGIEASTDRGSTWKFIEDVSGLRKAKSRAYILFPNGHYVGTIAATDGPVRAYIRRRIKQSNECTRQRLQKERMNK